MPSSILPQDHDGQELINAISSASLHFWISWWKIRIFQLTCEYAAIDSMIAEGMTPNEIMALGCRYRKEESMQGKDYKDYKHLREKAIGVKDESGFVLEKDLKKYEQLIIPFDK